jgi:hypothetical protein
VLDRLVRKALRHEDLTSVEPDAALLKLLNFVLTRPDACHDCGTAFTWAMKGVSTTEYMKDLFVGISSLRNGYNILMEHIVSWLPTVVQFVPAHDLPPDSVLSQLWSTLGIDDDVASSLVEKGVLFRGGSFVSRIDFATEQASWMS